MNLQWWCAAQDTAWSWTWRAYPGVWLFIGALALVFVRVLRRWGVDDDGLRLRTRAALGTAGLLALWAALDWPIGALGAGYLASVHMVQFILIAVTAPPLLLLGVPRGAWQALLGLRGVEPLARVLGHPIVTMSIFASAMAFTHWPAVADALMATQAGNFVLDLIWLVSGLAFWWPVAVSLPERSWLGDPFKIGYLIAATIVNTGVFAYITFSDLPLYATFELAPPVGVLSTRDDQLVAGLLMKIGAAAVLWTAITILFFRWYVRSEREERGAAVAVVAALALTACAPDAPTVSHAVVSEPVLGDRAALYLTVRGDDDGDVLRSIEVEGVGRAGLHRTVAREGMAAMEPAEDGLSVPPRGTLELRPGGDHGMLESLSIPFEAGDTVLVTLVFRDAGRVQVPAVIVPLAELDERLSGG